MTDMSSSFKIADEMYTHVLRNASNGICQAQTKLGMMILSGEAEYIYHQRIERQEQHREEQSARLGGNTTSTRSIPPPAATTTQKDKTEDEGVGDATSMEYEMECNGSKTQRAAHWFKLSASSNEPVGLYQLGLLLGQELIGGKAWEQVNWMKLISRSASFGYTPAKEFLTEWVRLKIVEGKQMQLLQE